MSVATPTIDGWSGNSVSIKAKKRESSQAPATPFTKHTGPALIGSSPIMKRLFSVIERVAPNDSSVLLIGATGTGKELVARAIHEQSSRRNGPFVDIN